MATKSDKAAHRLDAAQREHEAANANLAAIDRGEDAALDGREAHAAWREAMAAATADVNRLSRLVEKLEGEVKDESASDANKAQIKLEADADRAADAAAAVAKKNLSEISRLTRETLEAIAKADAKVLQAQRSRSEDLPRLQLTQARFRAGKTLPQEILSERVVERWCYPDTGIPLSKDLIGSVSSNDGMAGVIRSHALMSDSSGRGAPKIIKRAFRKTTFYPELRFGSFKHLAEELHIPAIVSNERPVWAPMGKAHPEAVLERLEMLNSSPAEREVLVLLEPINSALSAGRAA